MSKKIRQTSIIGELCRERMLHFPDSRLQELSAHGMGWAGVSRMRGAYEIRRTGLDCHLIIYTLSGSGWVMNEDLDAVLEPGQLWISPRGTPQEYGLAGKNWNMVWFYLADQRPWKAGVPGAVVRPSQHGPRLDHAMTGLLDELDADTPERSVLGGELIQLYSKLILRTLKEELGSEGTIPEDHRVVKLNRLVAHIRANLPDDWTVESMAECSELHVSPPHFARLFRETFGVSPMQLVTQLRLEEAQSLLLNTDYPHYIIAERVGYRNPYAFSTAFKRHYGCSPRDYLAQQKNR